VSRDEAMHQLRFLDDRQGVWKVTLLPSEIGGVDVIEDNIVDSTVCDEERQVLCRCWTLWKIHGKFHEIVNLLTNPAPISQADVPSL
jgi:hypothetical protein